MLKFVRGLLIILVCPVVGFSQHQVSLRSDVLDASPQIGSGGYNRPVRRPFLNAGNLFITGNVTGGKSFQGFVPYTDPTQLRVGLGSGTLSRFERDSFGFGDFGLGRGPAGVRPYFNPSSTVLPLPSRQQGVAVPGGAAPLRPVLQNPPSYITVPRPTERKKLQAPTDILPPSVRPSDILVPTFEPTEPVSEEQYEKLFTIYRDLLEDEQQEEELPEPTGPVISPEQPQTPPEEAQTPTKSEDTLSQLLIEAEEAAGEQEFRVLIGPQPEFYEAAKRLIIEAGKVPTTQKAKPLDPRVETRRPKPQVVTSLAGKGRHPVAQMMRSAERLMKRGRFYQAYERFDRVRQLKLQDPLPMLGMVHALIAAGRLRDAAVMLEAALTEFPKVLYLKLDGRSLLGSKAVLESRLNQVRRLSARRADDKQFLLLAGYIELLSGNRAKAVEMLEKAGAVESRKTTR